MDTARAKKRKKKKGRKSSGRERVCRTKDDDADRTVEGAPSIQLDLMRIFARRSKYEREKKSALLDSDNIFEIRDFLTKDECRATIDIIERVGFKVTDQRKTRYYARRRNGRLQVDAPKLAASLWERCKQFFPVMTESGARAVGLSPNFRFYKYEVGDRFGMHVDESVDHGSGTRSMYTLLVYLNASPDVRGGSTVFYVGEVPAKAKEVLRFPPREGSALAHIHGPRCLLHEGSVVKAGVKYLMRTDALYSL